MLRFERDALRGSTWCSPCPTPTAHTFERLYPGALRPGPRRADRRRHAITSAAASARPRRGRTSRVHRIDGLAAERGRHALFRPRDPAAHPPGRARSATLSIVGRAPTPAVRSSPTITASRSPAASTTSAAHRGGRRLRRAAADRRRHAAEDLRGDGDGQGRRLDHHRRRRACRSPTARDILIADEPARSPRRVVRLIRRCRAPRIETAAGDAGRRALRLVGRRPGLRSAGARSRAADVTAVPRRRVRADCPARKPGGLP